MNGSIKSGNSTAGGTTTRRVLLMRLASGLLLFAGGATPHAFAQELARQTETSGKRRGATPRATEGPFYPYDRLPLDRDNDLIVINKSLTPAVGVVTHLGGRLLDADGKPLKNAIVEIWQCDANAVYLAESDRAGGRQDANFQGYGRFETNAAGEYRFRTIKPVPYPGRPAPHIHVKVMAKGQPSLTTQLYVKNHVGNARDGIYREVGNADARALVTAEFVPLAGSKIGELTASWDIMLGRTPAEAEHAH